MSEGGGVEFLIIIISLSIIIIIIIMIISFLGLVTPLISGSPDHVGLKKLIGRNVRNVII